MENYRTRLSEHLIGKRIQEITITREKSLNVTVEQFRQHVEGQTIVAIDRKAKHLLFNLESGKVLLLHLMLGGVMYIGGEGDAPKRTKQVTFIFDDCSLFLMGLRLGYLHLHSLDQVEEKLRDLGPEPLDDSFTLDAFYKLAEKKRGMLKSALVNQKFISGIGNLYSDEICYQSCLLPQRKVQELTIQEKQALYRSIQAILKRGLTYGGYMDMPVYKGDLLTGQYNQHCYVYDREGELCKRCDSKILKAKVASRKSFFCNNCQR